MKAKHLVVDTAAFLKILPLWEYGEELYSVPEVIAEIRDKTARQRYESLPVPIKMRDPQPWAIRFVNEFTKKTGDYASLSLADVKILALTYEIEIEKKGNSDHLRTEPQKCIIEGPISSKVKSGDEPKVEGFHMPEEKSEGLMTKSSDILTEFFAENVDINSSDSYSTDLYTEENLATSIDYVEDHSFTLPSLSCPKSKEIATDSEPSTNIYWRHMLGLEDFLAGHSYIGGYSPTSDDRDIYKALVKEYPQFQPSSRSRYSSACSSVNLPPTNLRPLHSTFPCIRRWSYHISSFSEEERSKFESSGRNVGEVLHGFGERLQTMVESSPAPAFIDTTLQVGMNALSMTEQPSATDEEKNDEHNKETNVCHVTTVDDDVVKCNGNHKEELDEDDSEESSCEEEQSFDGIDEYDDLDDGDFNDDDDDADADDVNDDDDDDDDDGWITLANIKRHKLKSSRDVPKEENDDDVLVACITSDFPLQNTLKHIGLSVMGVDGKLIWQIRTFILRCYACFKTTSDMSKLFCPKCGNRTLKRVSVTINPDGTQKLWINFKKPISTRGMKFTLPRPRGGQHARNPILVADQKEVRQISSKKSKKKINPLDEDYDPNTAPFAIRDVYSRASQLGYSAGKCHNHYYWERKNPNVHMRKHKKKKE